MRTTACHQTGSRSHGVSHRRPRTWYVRVWNVHRPRLKVDLDEAISGALGLARKRLHLACRTFCTDFAVIIIASWGIGAARGLPCCRLYLPIHASHACSTTFHRSHRTLQARPLSSKRLDLPRGTGDAAGLADGWLGSSDRTLSAGFRAVVERAYLPDRTGA